METNSNFRLKTHLAGFGLFGLRLLGILLVTASLGFSQEPTPGATPMLSSGPVPPPINPAQNTPAPSATPSPGPVAASGTLVSGTVNGNALEKAPKGGGGKEKQPRTDAVYSALVLATNDQGASTTAATPELVPLVPRLKSIFGYNRFDLVGSHTEVMDNPDEHWLIPSKSFSLSIKSKREKNFSYLLNLQLFQEAKMLAGFDAKLNRESPIFIRGPLCGKGQLVIVLIVR